MSGQQPRQAALVQSYEHCRAVARREAKNFYYAFLALPPAKRNAMCAMYAFMRRADDIADDESLSLEQRRTMMAGWLNDFRESAGMSAAEYDPAETMSSNNDMQSTQDAFVFLAVRDTQQHFGIHDTLLEELVAGTVMDLEIEPPPGVVRSEVGRRAFDTYATVEALDRYCYLVASVVGLVTIRIFGFTDERANGYAVDLGRAFQYTNILRDVREDAERGRVYLPLELLTAAGIDVQDVAESANTGKMSPALRSAMSSLGKRASHLYDSGSALVPLLDADSRGAMRVLIAIYHELLFKLQRAQFEVMGERVRVSTRRKLLLLAKGMASGFAERFA